PTPTPMRVPVMWARRSGTNGTGTGRWLGHSQRVLRSCTGCRFGDRDIVSAGGGGPHERRCQVGAVPEVHVDVAREDRLGRESRRGTTLDRERVARRIGRRVVELVAAEGRSGWSDRAGGP